MGKFGLVLACILAICSLHPATGVVGNASAEEVCRAGGVDLANCRTNPRTFRSVVIAIPGWKGDCETGIGVGEQNLLNAIRQVGFFDVDCFDFEPDNTPFAKIEADLEKRFEALQTAGYTDIAVITHSTGGIIATNVILDQAFGDGDELSTGPVRAPLLGGKGPRLRGLYTWAIPMNGLTAPVDFAAWLGNIFKLSPELLPNLAPGSDFLKSKHAMWVRYVEQVQSMSDSDKALFQVTWLIFQGQDNDMVVSPIATTDAWLPPWAKLVDVEAFHTDMVSDSGMHDLPKFPGEVMTMELVASLPFKPRYDELFDASSPNTDRVKAQQRQVLDAVVELSRFFNVFSTVAPDINFFIARVLTGTHPRDAEFDEAAVATLAGLLDRTIVVQGPETVVSFADQMLSVIERNFPATYQVAGATSFGGGKALAVRALAESIDKLCTHVLKLTENGALERSLVVSGSRVEFDRKYGAVIQRLLGVQDEPTRELVVASLDRNLDALSVKAFEDTQVIEALAQYARVQSTQNDALANVFLRLQEKSTTLNDLVVKEMLPEVMTNPGGPALWNRILTNEDALLLLQRSTVQPESPQYLDLLRQMAARGSVDGRTNVLGNAALEQYEVIITPGTAAVAASGLAEAIDASSFEGTELRGVQLLRDSGYGEMVIRY